MNGKELLELAEVKRVPLRPGDTLAVYCSREPSDQEVDYIRRSLQVILEQGIRVMVLPPKFELEVLGSEEMT